MMSDQFVDELAQKVVRLRAVKTVDFSAATVGYNRRKSSDFMLSRNAHILVGVHFGQQELAVVFLH